MTWKRKRVVSRKIQNLWKVPSHLRLVENGLCFRRIHDSG